MRGVFCAAFLAVAVSAKRFATGSDGAGIDVDAYAGGVMRVRFRTSQAQYEVSDVVVAPAIPLVREECDGAQCSLATESTELALTKTEAGVQLKFSAEGRVLLDAKLGFAEEKPTASVTFPLAERFYGIPERAMDLALDRGASYRLFNLDVFEYKLDDKGPIYGSIPFLMGHGQKATAAVLWLNSADTTVDLKGEEDPTAAWQSDGGVADLFFFPGPTPMHVHKQHSNVVGPTMLPPAFSLGYHQCRWNYRSVADSVDVDAGFDKHNIPYDVLWLDIEHTDGKRYFTWDPHTFAEPEKLVSRLESKGRKLVTISDPHIKRAEGYHVHEEATAKGFYVKTESGADFEGHCWPGQSSWVDFFNKDARTWYASLFQYDRYRGSSPSVFTWIDMNEPSVFNAHEVTMDKKAVHTSHDGRKVSHGQLHNMYGYYHTMAAYEGHIKRNEKPMRPFILTRAFFSGSQRYAAMWTGDNMADWGHLQKSIPMLLTLSLSNYAFVGADVGGFFKNPSEELLVRWYQAAALTPFFRGHAHLETKRREPWLFGAEVTDRIRTAIALRYTLMPYLYTTFFQAHDQGTTVLRPLFYEWPTAAAHFTEQRAFMFGPAILARPVTEEGATTVTVPLPEGETWYAFPTGARHAPGTLELPITMDSIPAFVRGGYVVPTRGRLRRSTTGAVADPLTLYVALDAKGAAAGPVYLDDGASFAFEEGEYLYRRAEYRDGKLTLRPGVSQRCKKAADFASPVFVERVVLFGLPSAPTAASAVYTAAHGAPVELGASRPVDVTTVDGVTTIRRPQLLAQAEWTLSLSF